MKRKYRVVKLSRVYDDVEMVLSEIPETPSPPPRESTYQPDMKRIAEPILKTEAERIAYDIIRSFKKFAPGLAPSLEGRPTFLDSLLELMKSFDLDPPPKELFNITMIFSLKDYKELGSPMLESLMEFTLTKSNESDVS